MEVKHLRLVQWSHDFARMGSLGGTLSVDEEGWSRLKKAESEGYAAYFGEMLGKHSNVYITFEPGDFRVVSEDQRFVSEFARIVGDVGLNPLDYLDEED